MPEKFIINREHQEYLPAPDRVEALPTAEQAEALRPGEPDPSLKAEQARTVIAEAPVVENPIQKLEKAEESANASQPTFIDRNLRQISLSRELKQIRRRLPASDRALSRIIHQPAIRVISGTTAKSLSRPSGLLGGGLMAFVGTSGYLYLAKHIGFTYNYVIFFGLFIGGFLLGLLLELVVWSLTARRHRQM